MVWQRCVGFETNQALGGTEVNTDKLSIGQKESGWYPLFPLHSYAEKSDSDNSPWRTTPEKSDISFTLRSGMTKEDWLKTGPHWMVTGDMHPANYFYSIN